MHELIGLYFRPTELAQLDELRSNDSRFRDQYGPLSRSKALAKLIKQEVHHDGRQERPKTTDSTAFSFANTATA